MSFLWCFGVFFGALVLENLKEGVVEFSGGSREGAPGNMEGISVL
jgi:hypothetical protein